VQDREGVIQAWSNAAEKQYGWTEAEVLGKNLHNYVPAASQRSYNKVIDKILNGEPVTSFQTERLTKDQNVIRVACTVRTLTDDAGKISFIALVERPAGDPGKIGKKAGKT
jgi:PAS domain S-box-containing protein